MGTDDTIGYPADGEGPAREIEVSPFWIDTLAVSNERFARFVLATGHVTEAERFGWSFVFAGLLTRRLPAYARRRGRAVVATGLRRAVAPSGRTALLARRPARPSGRPRVVERRARVLRVGRQAAADRSGVGARGARRARRASAFPWGDEETPGGEHRCNVWQGTFPTENTRDDGFYGTAPVDRVRAQRLRPLQRRGQRLGVVRRLVRSDLPRRPARAAIRQGPPDGSARVMRGGSYLCHPSYCYRYRVAARSSNTPDSSTGNLGFRCAADDCDAASIAL